MNWLNVFRFFCEKVWKTLKWEKKEKTKKIEEFGEGTQWLVCLGWVTTTTMKKTFHPIHNLKSLKNELVWNYFWIPITYLMNIFFWFFQNKIEKLWKSIVILTICMFLLIHLWTISDLNPFWQTVLWSQSEGGGETGVR